MAHLRRGFAAADPERQRRATSSYWKIDAGRLGRPVIVRHWSLR
jgi:hypothetical protein